MHSCAFATSGCICRCQAFTASQPHPMFFALSTVSILGPRRQMMRFIIPPLSIADVPFAPTLATEVASGSNPSPIFECDYSTFFRLRFVTRYVTARKMSRARSFIASPLASFPFIFPRPQIMTLVSTSDS